VVIEVLACKSKHNSISHSTRSACALLG
jgi:hypothetical protein